MRINIEREISRGRYGGDRRLMERGREVED